MIKKSLDLLEEPSYSQPSSDQESMDDPPAEEEEEIDFFSAIGEGMAHGKILLWMWNFSVEKMLIILQIFYKILTILDTYLRKKF